MNDKTTELAFEIADIAMRSDIEAYCKPAEHTDIGTWYFDRSHEREYSAFIKKAIEYLTLRNRIAHHPDHADWIRVNFDAEVVKEVMTDIKLPELPEPYVRDGNYAGPPGEGASEDLWNIDQMNAHYLKGYNDAQSAVRDNASNIHDVAKMYASALRNRVAIYGPKNTKHNQVFLDVASFLDRISELNAVPDSEGGK